MNILLIGNGFDLAHKLPTKYEDFLEFCCRARRIFTYEENKDVNYYCKESLDGWDINMQIKKMLKDSFETRKNNKILNDDGTYTNSFVTTNEALNQLFPLIVNNVWLEYFLDSSSYIGENWIDFELEISSVIESLDQMRVIVSKEEDIDLLPKGRQKILMKLLEKAKGQLKDLYSTEKIDNLSLKLYGDLKRLVRALEIYLSEFVEKIDNEIIVPEIDDLEIDCVLSFNYTNTYKKKYGNGKQIKYNYIHGEASFLNTVDSNNMVLGIDEYLPEDRKDKETYFISFKKYYQRILKETGGDYFDWLNEINEDYRIACEKAKKYSSHIHIKELKPSNFKCHSTLYIFGHSLDITDGDILKLFICNSNVHTKIFYYKKNDDDKSTLERLIINLVKVIGPDELIRRTGGLTKTIEFIPQTIQK